MRKVEKEHIQVMIVLFLKYIREMKKAEDVVKWGTVERWLNSILDYINKL